MIRLTILLLAQTLSLEAGIATGEVPAVGVTVGGLGGPVGTHYEFGFDLVVDGGQGALEFKDELATRRIPVILGQVSHPYVSNEEIPNKEDYPPMDERLPANLTRAGVKTAIATFSRSFGSLAPAGSAKWLLIDAGIASGYGLSEADVLKAVTLIPAEILGVANRVGSLEVGKDADVIVLDGPPLSVKTWVQRVYVGGELVFQK